MKAPALTQKVPFLSKLAFGSGDLGTAITAGVLGFFRLIFMTDVAGLNPALAGAVLLIGRVWDAVNDPIIGTISDRLKTRWGRRRPMFLLGALPFALTFILVFYAPPFDQTGKFIYYVIAGLLFDTFYTVVNVPYTALTAEMTSDYDERTSMNSFRFGFSIIGSLLAVIGYTAISGALRDSLGQAGAILVAVSVLAAVSGVPYILAFLGTYERPEVAAAYQAEPPMSVLDGIKTTFASIPFRYVAGIYLASWLSLMTVQTVLVYFLNYWLRRPDLQLPVVLGVQVTALLFVFIWSKISQKIGKQRTYVSGMGFWIVISFALFAVPADAADFVPMLLGALAGVGVAVAYLIPWSMLPDVIEEDELKTGRRREGAFYGYFALLQKFGAAVGSGLIGLALAATGYITPPENITTPIAQPESALLAIRLMIGPIPAIMLAIGIVLALRFPITKAHHEQTLAALAKRKAAKA